MQVMDVGYYFLPAKATKNNLSLFDRAILVDAHLFEFLLWKLK